MEIKTTCPSCGQALVLDSTAAGQPTNCPKCSASFIAPAMARVDAGAISNAPKSGMAVTSMVLGILSLICFGILTGIPAIILGHIALGRTRKAPAQYAGGGMAIAGFVLGYLSIFVTLVILPAMLLPALSAAKHKAQMINSVNNLKQIGMAFRVWEINHQDQLPFNVSQAQGGVKELCTTDNDGYEKNPTAVFMVMSNELSNPRILVCPNDPQKQAATNFSSLTANNITYQLRTGTDVNDSHPAAILAVDPINGIVLHCDGSVQFDSH